MGKQYPVNNEKIYRPAIRAAQLGLLVNLGLAVAKSAAGVYSQSFAMLSDAINSLGDCLTSGVVLYALKLAQKPADQEHPYGHSKAEGIAASNIAVLILCSAAFMLWEIYSHARSSTVQATWWIILLSIGTIVIKEGLFQYKHAIGKKIKSASLIANAWDHRMDAMSSTAVLIGLVAVYYGGPQYAWADTVAAMLVLCGVGYSSLHLLRESSRELMDSQAEPEFVQQVQQCAEQVADVLFIETLYVRKTGLEYLVDIHICVEANLSVADGHEIGHAVKDRIIHSFLPIRDVLVHIEPYTPAIKNRS